MKKFLIKVAFYISAQLVIISLIVLYLYSQIPNEFSLVSNSVSYNLKAGYIRRHPEKLQKSRIVVVGSSMSLNNVDANMLQDSFGVPSINLSSWGVTISNYQGSPIWDQPKIFLCNVGVLDFGDSKVKSWDNFSFNSSGLQEVFNLSTNLSTTHYVIKQAKEILSIHNTRKYASNYYDECGSVLLSDSAFDLDSTRWNEDPFVLAKFDSARLIDYVQRLKKMTSSHHGYAQIIISFSPTRRIFYNRNRSGMIAWLARMINDTCPNVLFINLYDRYYSDTEYADASHFNVKGANQYTRELIDSIRNRGILNTGGSGMSPTMIQKLADEDKNCIMYSIDGLIQHAKTRQAYAK